MGFMDPKDFISGALNNSTHQIAYYVGEKLAARFPDKGIIYGCEDWFDPLQFADGEQCSIVQETSVFNQLLTEWEGRGRPLRTRPENAWFTVLWGTEIIEVVFISWIDDCYKSRQHWIIADTRQVAEAFLRSVCEWCCMPRSQVLVFQGGGWWKNKDLFESVQRASFDDIVLPGGLKQEIQMDLENFFQSKATYEQYGVAWRRGLFFVGPPGNGKTQTVKALIKQARKPCLYIKSFESLHGSVDANVKEVFNRARQSAPCVVVMEDLDSLISKKSLSFLLNEMDGFAENNGIAVLATTNNPERIDPALIDRPGRFDRKFHFGPPGPAERREYLRQWNNSLAEEMRLTEQGLEQVAGVTEGFSFAYLKELRISAMTEWVSGSRTVSMDRVMESRAAILKEQMRSPKDLKGNKKKAKKNQEASRGVATGR
jgi:ATPase family associated with various cellular activities (AAA)